MADLNLASCFQYENPSNGDLVVKAPVEDYVQLIGKKVCSHVTLISTFQNGLASLASRIKVLESAPVSKYTLPSIKPIGIADPNTAISLDAFVKLLEEQFIIERNAIGTPTALFNAITVLNGLNGSNALGTSGGKLSSLNGWTSNITDFSQMVVNVALIAQDLRSAVQNMKLSCCTGSCNSVEIALQANYATRILTLIFTGSIPDNLVNDGAGWLVKIEDQSGNYVNSTIDIKANLNVASGVTIDLTASSLNFADDLKVSGVYSLKDDNIGTVCQKYLEKIVSNQSSCPSITISPSFTSIGFSFIHVEGNLTYSVQLYSSTNLLLQTRQFGVTGPTNINGSFTGLTSGTSYKVRINMITTTTSKLCPFVVTETLDNNCPAPNAVTAELTY